MDAAEVDGDAVGEVAGVREVVVERTNHCQCVAVEVVDFV